jgi:RND superfamily putative drug exporter
VQIDISNRLGAALLPFGIIVVGLSILLLMLVFRSVLVPIKAALGFLLSVVASFGVVVAVFQWGWFSEFTGVEPGPILSFMPVLLMAVLFGLAMDYEVFLVSGMREQYVHGASPKRAIERGFGGAARVVTAAALIMFFVFFAFVPEGSGVIKVIALGLACGILFDAFLVRMTLVPAVMTLLGKSAWWLPRWLDRLLPNVDIEGESLREHRSAGEWTAGESDWHITADGLVTEVGPEPAGDPVELVGVVDPVNPINPVDSVEPVEPVSFRAPAGALVLLEGPRDWRRRLGATLAGRRDPVAGRAQVAGHPLPSDRAIVRRLVAMSMHGSGLAGYGMSGSATGSGMTVGQLLAEQLRLSGAGRGIRTATGTGVAPGIRPAPDTGSARGARSAPSTRSAPGVRTVTQDWIDRIAAVSGHPLTAGTPVHSLPALDRAIVDAAATLAEGSPVVLLDCADGVDPHAFVAAVDRLASAGTTLLIGVDQPVHPSTDRVVIEASAPAQLKGLLS